MGRVRVNAAGSCEQIKGDLRVLHISDLHRLALSDTSPLDLNRRFRDSLEEDVKQLIAEGGGLNAIFVGGDIANSGQAHEFDAAGNWIELLCGIGGISHRQVYCVPGNHDVDRGEVAKDGLVRIAENYFRTCPVPDIDKPLIEVLATKEGGEPFLKRLNNYHEFAARYDCPVTPEEYAWKRELPEKLGGRSVVVVGLNSSMISSGRDGRDRCCDDAERMFLGQGQAYLHRNDDSIVIALCHHPLTWLRDAEAVRESLERAQLQLFGHEHELEIASTESWVRITAGAVQPPASQASASPAYNLIELQVEGEEMRVMVKARKWDGKRFGADPKHGPEKEISLQLSGGQTTEPEEAVGVASEIRREAMWQLMKRSPEGRRSVLSRMGLVPSDQPLTGFALGEAVAAVAERDQWAELAQELDK